MSLIPRRILVVAHDQMLRTTRVSILEKEGYTVSSAVTDDDAMALLKTEKFDLILLGRKSQIPKTGVIGNRVGTWLLSDASPDSEPHSLTTCSTTWCHQ